MSGSTVSGAMTFTATSRPRSRSRAAYTIAHPAARDLAADLVAGAGEVRPRGDAPQVVEGAVADLAHGASTPRRARASARNSSSEAVVSRSVSSTSRRSSRRAQCRWFVTWETVRPNSPASAA